jgi:cbb3-type cytochrome oxidase maturation protein
LPAINLTGTLDFGLKQSKNNFNSGEGCMELTWIAIAASLLMGGGALLIFIWAARSHQFRRFEDVKYQVFWSDAHEPPPAPKKEQQHGSSTQAH